MGCVNKSSREFRSLAARNNIDDNTLELITHKYWLETGNETLFPTDVYIQAQLGNGQYQEDGKSVRKLWEKRYSHPMEYQSLGEIQAAQKEAFKYFPKSAVYFYKNAKGSYMLSVKKPVGKVKHDKESFFIKLDNMESPSDIKTLNLGIKDDRPYGIETVQSLYNRFNNDRTTKDLADKVFKLAKDLNISFSFNDTLPSGIVGRYENNNTIIYKKSFLESNMENDKKAPIILHELLHAVSSYALSDQMDVSKLSEPMQKFRVEMNSLYQDLKTNPALKGERGIVNVKEFVAELSNPVFRAKIKEIDKANKENKTKKSFWQRVLNAFKSLLNLHVTSSYYERSMKALDNALDAFDIDSYMRYNNFKNQLRQEVSDNKIKTQLNKRIDVINNAVKSGDWSPNALRELDNIINDIENGKVTYQRFPQEASRAYHQGGRANEAASILLGTSNNSSAKNPQSFSEKYERDKREQPIQERIIENWAKAKGIWYDNLDTVKGKKQIAEGGEAKVFFNGDEKNVTKILSTEYFITPQFALDRITLHNALFPAAPLEVVGFGRNSQGEFQFLVEQPFIQGTPATQEEIDAFITKAGFVKSRKDKGNTFISDDLYLSDLHDENVIKTLQGDLIVIDADLRLNTPDLNRDGKYVINDNIVSTEDTKANAFIRTLSPTQLDKEKKLIEQEYDDYDLSNGIKEEENKKSSKAVPQDFTFNDGTVIKAPFMPNSQQIDALNAMSDFIKSRETSMTLSGYAGTGKTSLMEMIAKKCRKQGKPVMFCATTNKAAAVLNDRVSKAGFKATTLNKTFGINVEIDPNAKSYNARNLVNNLKEVDIMPGTTIIIDEASMINEENYRILNNIAEQYGLKVIYVGDEAQLAPVNEGKISKVFRNGEGKVIRLTQVERTDDNAILKEATAIRNGEALSGETSFNSKGEGVAYLSPEHQDAINKVIEHYVKGLRKDPNYFRILAYTNKAVADYNNQVRKLLGYDSPIPQEGEPMTGYANWGYNWKTKSYRFINSESYKVLSTGKAKTVVTRLDDGTPITMEAIPITLEDSLGNRDTFDFMDIKANRQNRQAAMMLANEKKRLWAKARQVYNRQAKVEIYAKINHIDSFLFVNDNIEDNDHNLLQAKTIDFGYALTIHKSQGSTFTNVLMDDVDVSKSAFSGNDAANAMEVLDVGIESKNNPSNANLTSTEDVDLGDLSDVTETPKQNDQAANIKQQLEYVGVSRATDTVTIVSNHIKKEGSPLDPKKDVKEDAIKRNDTRSNNNGVSKVQLDRIKNATVIWGHPGTGKTWMFKQGRKDIIDFDSEYKAKLGNLQEREILKKKIGKEEYNKKLDELFDQAKAEAKATGKKLLVSDMHFLRDRSEDLDVITNISNEEFIQRSHQRGEHDEADKMEWKNSINKAMQNVSPDKVINTTGYISNLLDNALQDTNNVNNGTEYKATDEFRRVQEAVRKGSQGQQRSVLGRNLPTNKRQDLANVLGRQLRSINSFTHGSSRNVVNQKHNTSFNIHSEVNPQLFHDIFEVVRYYADNGELVDLHDDYSNCKCFLSEDGTAGFAVESDGNLVSVFNLGTTKGFLSAIKDLVREAGATHLDAYASSQQNLQRMYEVTLGFHTAATMDYNMEYDHDDIAKNHGNPQVVFMVDHEVENPRHFDKDSYNAAKEYQMEQVKKPSIPSSYEGYITPDKDTIFVFGSNPEGRHGAGAAKTAKEKFGAIYGQGEGLQGNAYALPTKDLRVKENRGFKSISPTQITENIKKMYDVARQNPSKQFKVAYTNGLEETTLNGYTGAEMVKMFKDAGPIPSNVIFSKNWTDHWNEVASDYVEESVVENPTFEEAKTFKVQLPNYEFLNDIHEEITVDAEWKIPYLKELDAQVTGANSDEENQNIFNQMDNIFTATSKEEYLQDVNNSKVNKTKRKLSEYEKLNKQLDNLLEGGNEDYEEVDAKLPATEVRHTAELIMNSISDEITRLQTEEGRAKKLFPSLNTELDFQTATRRQIVETVGINRLIDRAKALFDSENNDYDDYVTSLQADLITENWDALMKMGSDIFAFNEGFGITKDYSNGRFNTTDDSRIDYDNFNDYGNDPDVAAEEGEKDEQEKWQVDVKTIDVMNSMSALVRQGIHECYKLDANGNKIMSKWGIPERVEPREAVNSILRWTQGALSLNDMIRLLSDKQIQNPWLSQLIERLSDKSGKETDFQSQFYGVFSKHFQPYSIVLLEDGKYHSMLVNSHPALTDVMRSITSMVRIGEHPLFGNANKVNAKLLGNNTTVGNSNDFNLCKALAELRSMSKSLSQGKEFDNDMLKAASDNIIGVCKILGFGDVTEDMIADVLNADVIKKETEYLGYIVNSLEKALKAQNKGELKDYEPFGFKKQHSIDGSVKNFLTPITDRMEDTAVNAFYDSGKMYQSYTTPSFMSKLMKKFHQEGKAFEDFMREEYGSSEWFAFNNSGDFGKIQWRNEWLRLLAKDEGARKMFSHQIELNFNKHNYMRNMTDAEYTLSLITQYFGESTKKDEDMVPAWFRIPMQSNKPSSDFIRFYSYRGSNYKKSIIKGLHNIFLQELSRIQTVRMRSLSKKDAGFIKNFDTNGRKFNFLPVFNAYLENTPVTKAKREALHNRVNYNEDRLSELQQKEDTWKKEVDKYNEWESQYVAQKTDEDILYEKDNDPVINQERDRVKSYQLSSNEQAEFDALKRQKEADDRALSTEEDDRFASLLQKKIAGEEALTSEEEVELGNLVDKILRQFMENRVQSILDNWESNGILEAAKSIKDIYPAKLEKEEAKAWVREQVENFLWNDAFASKNILELTIGDIAFYKDTEDLQKRLAQLHAPGIRGRIDATDYEGNRVSDGKYRTFILKDFDTFKSNIIANISEVFDRKIAEADDSQKAQMIALKESLVGENGKYTQINVTDAQGYSSPASYRKKAFIFGRWSREAEETYQRIKSGDYTLTDFETAFQPLKPFVYSMLDKNLGVDNAPIHNMKVPFQAKNAEYLLIMADAILQGEKLSRPNLLRAVYRVMEDSEKINPTMGIDTVQFESAIKSGLQGQMDISQFMEMEDGENMAYGYMMDHIYKEQKDDAGNRIYKDYDKDSFVHETSYEDYCLQQEVPEHFKLHSQAHGSQIRMITPSDLDFYTTDENGNQVDNYYTWTEPDGTVRKVKADEFRKEYEQTIAENIEESINDLAAELHYDSKDKKERNIALSEILQREIVSSPRYGLDMMQACSIDKETGEFRIPKGDPIQAKRIEQLINSIIKNRVNKQKIAGGPIVQVSNFGTSRQLHIRFNDRQGNLMPLEEEYNPSEHDGLSYKDYCKKNQGGIAYFEVFCPMWNDEIYEKFSNTDGTINIDAINAMDPEYLKMVSYRIPTEDKYSCAPIKVVGFMPRWAGDAIMFPYELTEIDDSDFDVDKRYVMRKDIPIKTKRRRDIETELFKRASESYKKAHDGRTANEKIGEQVRMFMDNPQKMKNADSLMKWLYKQYQSIAYYTEAPTSGRQYRDNKIIDMTYAVLTNERTADKILNPGGFDAPKKMGYMVAAYKNPANNVKWEDLEKMSIQKLKDLSYTDKDLTFADTQVQFYKQNSAAASLIGVFAVNKAAHATLESNGINLCVSDICGDTPISIAGTTFGKEVEMRGKDRDGNDITIKKRMQVIDAKYDSQGTLIGKTLGSLTAASADAVKDPILNLMNINMTTTGMLNTMLRFGMPFNNAALFFSQDIIERLLSQFNRENLSNYVSLDSLINKWLNSYREKHDINDASLINSQPLEKNELVNGLTSEEHEETDYKVLLAFQKLKALTDAMRKPTYATRFNSISSAVGPLIVDNLIMEHKMESFLEEKMNNGTPFFTYDSDYNEWIPMDISDIFNEHPILKQFSRTVNIAKSLFSDMPTGSNGFRNLLAKLPEDISYKMYSDKKLLDQFSNFYQSYLLIQSGLINPSDLYDTVMNFPKEFIEGKYKEKYKDNALIQAIRLNVARKTGRPFLQINLTGMDERQKEELRYAWVDLHKDNPELSKKLFDYSFFRAGIGFSPKTFMSLVPLYVKERLKNGNASYVDTYRNFPTIVPELVIDQFIRNNWDNSKLVPWRGDKNTKYNVDIKHNRLTVYREEDKEDVENLTYMKTSQNKTNYLWHNVGKESNGDIVFELVKPLGNNGEYLEMDLSDIQHPLNETLQALENNDSSELKETDVQETSAEEPSNPVISKSETIRDVSELADLVMRQNPKLDKEGSLKKIEEMSKNPRLYAKFLQNVFKQKGLDLDLNETINEFKKYC